MASKKTVIPQAPEAPQEEVKEMQEAVAQDEQNFQEAEKEPVKESEAVGVKEEDLPDYAKRTLKVFSDQPELYISANGGAFTKDAKPELRGSAILYKNPYYKL